MNNSLIIGFAMCFLVLLLVSGVRDVSANQTAYTCNGGAMPWGFTAAVCPQEPNIGDHVTLEFNSPNGFVARCHADVISKTTSWFWNGSAKAKIAESPAQDICHEIAHVGTEVTIKW